ncbi:MAG: ankyrin repeat domain-containing protein [Luteitalea sp.]|nr:ankyrin repeat domain-containing protein [Luteitalea sp.]
MAARELPARPDLEQYKKQAKELVKAWKAGDPAALARIRKHHPRLSARPDPDLRPATFTLADAQFVLAREHGFESWPKFAKHIGAVTEQSPSDRIWRAAEEAVDAIVTGDARTVERLLHANPDLVHARSTRTHRSTLLHYVGANGVEGFRQRTPKNAVRIADILLSAGSDIDATAGMYGGSTTLGLMATSIHPVTAGVQEELMAFLLDRGASVGDATGTAAWSHLINGCHANGRGKAAEFLAKRAPGLDLEAAAGAGRLDVVKSFFTSDGPLKGNTTETQMRDGFTWACEYGRSDVVDFLLQQGVDVNAKLKHDGQTGLHWAAYGGHPGTVRVLLRRNAHVNAKDERFGGTPLGWALYAWGGSERRTASSSGHYDVVEILVDAGATVDGDWLAESERGFPLARRIREDARMRAALGSGR